MTCPTLFTARKVGANWFVLFAGTLIASGPKEDEDFAKLAAEKLQLRLVEVLSEPLPEVTALAEVEREHFLRIVQQFPNPEARRILGMPHTTFYRRLQKYGVGRTA